MTEIKPMLTDTGRAFIVRALGGETITFTKFVLGSGTPSGSAAALEAVVTPKMNVSIGSTDTTRAGYIKLTGTFNSSAVSSSFKWTELGVMATITNASGTSAEKLYAYSNDGANAGNLVADSAVLTQFTLNVYVAIGNAANIDVITSDSHDPLLTDHIYDMENPHETTKAHVGLSEVENYSINNMPPTYGTSDIPSTVADLNYHASDKTKADKFKVIMGKLWRAVHSLKEHLADYSNPHRVTYSQIHAAHEDHTHSTYIPWSGHETKAMTGKLIGQGNVDYKKQQFRNIVIGKESIVGSPGEAAKNYGYTNGTLIIYTEE